MSHCAECAGPGLGGLQTKLFLATRPVIQQDAEHRMRCNASIASHATSVHQVVCVFLAKVTWTVAWVCLSHPSSDWVTDAHPIFQSVSVVTV
jgi:hypothetical protein